MTAIKLGSTSLFYFFGVPSGKALTQILGQLEVSELPDVSMHFPKGSREVGREVICKQLSFDER